MNDKNKKIQNQLDEHDMKIENHEMRIKTLERIIKSKKPKGPKGPDCKIPKPPAWFSAWNKTMFEPLVNDVKDLKVRVTKLEDDNVKLKAELKADMVQLLDERDVKLKNDMVKMLDERDKKWEAKFDEMNNGFEDKVVKVIKKINKSKS